MLTAIHYINKIFAFVFDLACLPLAALSPFWSLTVISGVVGVFMVWIFGKFSDQEAIKKVKNHIGANLLAIRLFKEDFGVFFRIQGSIFRDTFIYMKYSLKPMLVMFVPVTLVIVQLNHHYDSRPLRVGEKAMVKVKTADLALLASPDRVMVEPGAGFSMDTKGIRIPAKNEIVWRIRAEKEGNHQFVLFCNKNKIEKSLCVGDDEGHVARLRTGSGVFEHLLYPTEPPIAAVTGIKSIEIQYPERTVSILGKKMNWLIQFFVFSIAFGYLFKGVLGVQV